MFGLDFDDFFELRLIEVISCILENILWLLFEDFEQEDRNHILEFGMVP